jgi:hypothetical protein
MSNQLALKMIHDTHSIGVETYPLAPRHSHTDNAEGFRVDNVTGEIYGEYIATPFAPEPIPVEEKLRVPLATCNSRQYLHLTASNNSNALHAEFGDPASDQPIATVESSCTKPRRGPKPKVRLNPHVASIKIAIAERAHWIEDAVMAGIYIAVGSNNGKLNIKPGYVRKVLTIPVISADTIASHPAFRNHDLKPVSERYVRYLAAAGRLALGSIERHLDRHPDEQQRLEAKVLAPSSWGEEFDLEEGDYFEVEKVTRH